ncbi:hypothetical protein ACKN8S_01805 [Limosilactobacillus reuteri]|uniref:hypothetical protein n=1 Tax=Limosilactobacillus reuteri TaxID=1598 RepID=UPI0039BEDCFD
MDNTNNLELESELCGFHLYEKEGSARAHILDPENVEKEYSLYSGKSAYDDIWDIINILDRINLTSAKDDWGYYDNAVVCYMDELGLKKEDFKLDENGEFDLDAGEPLSTISEKEAEYFKEKSLEDLVGYCCSIKNYIGSPSYELYAVVATSLDGYKPHEVKTWNLEFNENGNVDLSTKNVLRYIEDDITIESQIDDLINIFSPDLDELNEAESLLPLYEKYEGSKQSVDDYKETIAELRESLNEE